MTSRTNLQRAEQTGDGSNEPCLSFYLNDEAVARDISFSAPRAGDAGFDLRCLESTSIDPQTFKLIRTGLHIAVPTGWVALVRDRSSVALRGGVVAAGVIDASYRGEVHVLIHNFGLETLRFEQGERVAQCVVVPHLGSAQSVDSVDMLGSTERGSGGFGSTGRL
jgi:dUTP pyrophosphatase